MPRRTQVVLGSCIVVTLLSIAAWLLMFPARGPDRPYFPGRLAALRKVPPGFRNTPPIPRFTGAAAKRREDRNRREEHKDQNEDIGARFRSDQPRSSLKEIQASLANVAPTSPFLWINPGPVNPYVQIGGQYTGVSGKLQAFAWEPSHPQVMYAGGGIGSGNEGPATETGVFKTNDGGNTWTPINNGLLDPMVDVLWIDVSNPDILLAGTEFGGLFRTMDAGQSWTQVSRDAPVSAMVTVAGGVLAGTGVGLELSTDDGATWTVLQNTPSPVRCLAANGGDIVAGLDQGGLLWKAPSDLTWRTVVAPNSQFTVWDLAIDPVDPSVAYYVRGYGGPPDNLVFRTMNRGASWQVIDAPTTTNGGYSQTVAVNPEDRSVLVAGQSMFYASPDFGATWTRLNGPWDSRKIFVLPGTSSLVIGSDHGLHWTDDLGKTWIDLTKSISSNILFSAAADNPHVIAGFRPIPFDGRRQYMGRTDRSAGRRRRCGHQP